MDFGKGCGVGNSITAPLRWAQGMRQVHWTRLAVMNHWAFNQFVVNGGVIRDFPLCVGRSYCKREGGHELLGVSKLGD
jgi:hypothetical protein